MATEGVTTNLLFNVLSRHYDVRHIVLESPVSKKQRIKYRLNKLGWISTVGQILFQFIVPPILSRLSKKRVNGIIEEFGFKNEEIPHSLISRIESVNTDPSLLKIVKNINPDLIFVNGTRIISKKIIDSSNCDLINIHVGITPKYRGVHGGYWALYNKEKDLFGTTLHLIDVGVDTGGVIDQIVLQVSREDNFSTYPILQYCGGLKLIEKNLDKLNSNSISTQRPIVNESQLFFHPTIFQYLSKKIR